MKQRIILFVVVAVFGMMVNTTIADSPAEQAFRSVLGGYAAGDTLDRDSAISVGEVLDLLDHLMAGPIVTVNGPTIRRLRAQIKRNAEQNRDAFFRWLRVGTDYDPAALAVFKTAPESDSLTVIGERAVEAVRATLRQPVDTAAIAQAVAKQIPAAATPGQVTKLQGQLSALEQWAKKKGMK